MDHHRQLYQTCMTPYLSKVSLIFGSMKLLTAIAIGAVACGAQQPCADQILNNTGIGEKAYKFLDASDFSSCCAACANETKCAAWMGESSSRPAQSGRTKHGLGRCTPNSDMAKSLTGRFLCCGRSAR